MQMTRELNRKLHGDNFIEKSIKIYGHIYDYSESVYIDRLTKLKIICPKHGDFFVSPVRHYSGGQCPCCPKIPITKKVYHKRMTEEEFFKKIKRLHKDEYDYSNSVFNGAEKHLNVTCRKHGVFSIVGYNHLRGDGCKECSLERWGIWGEEQDAFLRKNYTSKGATWCSKKLKRPTSTISYRAGLLKLEKKLRDKGKYIPNAVWYGIVSRCEKHGWDLKIDRKFIWNLFLEQDRKCALTGWDIFFAQGGTASVDRINSDLGYEKGNIQIIHKDVNRMKSDFSEQRFYEVCAACAEFRRKDFGIKISP